MAEEDFKSQEGRWCFGCTRPLIGMGGRGDKDDPQFLKVLLLGSHKLDETDEGFWKDVEPFRIIKKVGIKKASPLSEPLTPGSNHFHYLNTIYVSLIYRFMIQLCVCMSMCVYVYNPPTHTCASIQICTLQEIGECDYLTLNLRRYSNNG